MKKISIIIPVYNVEKYIEKCLLSIKNQTMREADIEVIIINDGSIDRTEEICKDFFGENWIYIKTQNNGQACARNIGLEKAKGKYILFLDGDDTLPTSACEVLYQKIEKENADLVIGNQVLKNENTFEKVAYFQEWFEDIRRDNYKICPRISIGIPVVTGKIFLKSSLNNIRFPEGITGEDVVFSVYSFNSAKKIVLTDDIVYCRTKRSDNDDLSTMQIVSAKIIKDRIQVIKLIDKFCEKENLNEIKKYNRAGTLNYIFETARKIEDKAERNKSYIMILKLFLNKEILKKDNIKNLLFALKEWIIN